MDKTSRGAFGLVALVVALFIGFWWVEGEWLARREARKNATVAVRDLVPGEYVTAAHVAGRADAAILDKLVNAAKRKGDALTANDVTPSAAASIVSVVLDAERSLGTALRVGLCVQVWNTEKAPELLAQQATVVTVLPVASDGRRQVFLALPVVGQAGVVLAAVKPALAINVTCSRFPPLDAAV